jgi:hypothetical protein
MNSDALASIVALILLAVLFYGPWQATCTDWARQILFENRDKIFDMAQAGEIDFDSAEYAEIRKSLQGLIRYCHHVTLPMLLIHLLAGVDSTESALKSSIAKIPSIEARNKVYKYVSSAQKAVLVSILAKSLPGLGIIIASWIASKLHLNRRKYARVFSERIQRDSEIAAY